MPHGVIHKYPALGRFQTFRLPYGTVLIAALCMLLALAVAAAWAHSRSSLAQPV
jgi:hypothetical protein